jgi:hypothetical protein
MLARGCEMGSNKGCAEGLQRSVEYTEGKAGF